MQRIWQLSSAPSRVGERVLWYGGPSQWTRTLGLGARRIVGLFFDGGGTSGEISG